MTQETKPSIFRDIFFTFSSCAERKEVFIRAAAFLADVFSIVTVLPLLARVVAAIQVEMRNPTQVKAGVIGNGIFDNAGVIGNGIFDNEAFLNPYEDSEKTEPDDGNDTILQRINNLRETIRKADLESLSIDELYGFYSAISREYQKMKSEGNSRSLNIVQVTLSVIEAFVRKVESSSSNKLLVDGFEHAMRASLQWHLEALSDSSSIKPSLKDLIRRLDAALPPHNHK